MAPLALTCSSGFRDAHSSAIGPACTACACCSGRRSCCCRVSAAAGIAAAQASFVGVIEVVRLADVVSEDHRRDLLELAASRTGRLAPLPGCAGRSAVRSDPSLAVDAVPCVPSAAVVAERACKDLSRSLSSRGCLESLRWLAPAGCCLMCGAAFGGLSWGRDCHRGCMC